MKGTRRWLCGWLLVAVGTGSGWSAQTAGMPEEGSWEGEIRGDRRPYRVELVLRGAGPGEPLQVVLDGRFHLPVADFSLGSGTLEFLTNLNGQDLHFRLSPRGDDLAGSVEAGGSRLEIDLWRSRTYPKPASREEAWRQDLDAVERRFLRFDRSFTESGKERFRQELRALERDLPRLSDSRVIVRLSEMAGAAGNAHTRLYLLRNRSELRRLPIRIYWFQEGAFVVQARLEQRHLLGCRVDRIEDRSAAEVLDRVTRLFAGNRSWQLYKSTYFMTSPEILEGIEVARTAERIRVRFDCPGEVRDETLEPLPLQRSSEATEAWWDLLPEAPSGWVSLLDSNTAPLYLGERDRHYWMSYLPEENLLYFQYNRSQNMPGGESLEEFGLRLKEVLANRKPRSLVVDLRFNTGGNIGVAEDLMGELAAFNRTDPSRRLYVITGRATFSAGITHTGQFASWQGAVLVGEEVGDWLDTWSEGGNLVLPNSGLTVHYTNGFHAYSRREYPEFRPYFEDLDLEDWQVKPHFRIEPLFSAYREGRDPVMEAIVGNTPR